VGHVKCHEHELHVPRSATAFNGGTDAQYEDPWLGHVKCHEHAVHMFANPPPPSTRT
jgi:hypothetical protein